MSETEQNVIFIFPGQGSQYRGIGSDLCAEFDSARRIYEQASDVLGYDMAKLSHEDPNDQINLTRYTQPV
ncbi:MAG: malonyl CoA-acyl carrier protein transacylase, partial [Chromatiales bacterium]|nr:malonyl CoA-acyl carrier protein transacylase [Chromatiales bacterium]